MKDRNKRKKIGLATDKKSLEKKPNSETKRNSKNYLLESPDKEYLDDDGNFMWDAYEATCISSARKINPHIKTKAGERVYSKESYAQSFYGILNEFEIDQKIKTKIDVGQIYDGIVYATTPETISIDIGYRELVYVQSNKEPNEYRDIEVGEEVAVLITNTDNSYVSGSISGGIKQKIFMDLRAGVESGDTAWVGKVSHMIENGGYIVNIHGIECFMPGSLAGINKLVNFESIVGKELYVVPVSFSMERGTIVVSHRKYLQALIPNEIDKIKDNMDDEITGNVTGTAKYGIFVEFYGCLTGMIHKNDINEETYKLFVNNKIKPGSEITFKVKEIISHKKITLTQKSKSEIDPWYDIKSRYKIPSIVNAEVKSKKDYGLFIKIEDGVVGLLHVSEIGEDIIKAFNTGDNITVKIIRIEEESQRVYLKLP